MPKLGETCYITRSSGVIQKSPIPTSKMTNAFIVSMNRKPKCLVNETTETRRSKRLARKRSSQLESITDDDLTNDRNRSNYVNRLKRFKISKSNETKSEILTMPSEINHESVKTSNNKLSYLGENPPLEIIGSLGKECNKTGSSSIIQKSPIPTGKINNEMSVAINSKPKSLVNNETTETRRFERLIRHKSLTDDNSNDPNQLNDDKNVKRFEYSHTYGMSVKNIKNCSDSFKAVDGIVLSTVVETINVFTKNQSINLTNKICEKSISWNLNSSIQFESCSMEAIDESDNFERVDKLVTSIDTALSTELLYYDDLHEQLLSTTNDLESLERDFYLLSKRFGIPSEECIQYMAVEDPHSVREEIYSESITQSTVTLLSMIPDEFKENITKHDKESSSNEDLKLANEKDSLRKDIAYLINELDYLIGEFPKTLTSWELSKVCNDPLT